VSLYIIIFIKPSDKQLTAKEGLNEGIRGKTGLTFVVSCGAVIKIFRGGDKRMMTKGRDAVYKW